MTAQLLEVPLRRLYVDPVNPRRGGAGDVTELAESIRDVGILNPLIVRVGQSPGRYGILSGQRRLAAAKLADLDTAPCMVHDPPDDATALVIATAENVGRKAMNPIEDARSFRAILDAEPGMTQTELGNRLGVSQFLVSTRLQLLTLSQAEQDAIADGRLSASAAYARLKRSRPRTGVNAPRARRRPREETTTRAEDRPASWIDHDLAAHVTAALIKPGRGTRNGDTPAALVRRAVSRELVRPSCWVPDCHDDALSGGRFCPEHLDMLPLLRRRLAERARLRGAEPAAVELQDQAVEFLLTAPWRNGQGASRG